jgi:hypothetical protein
LILEIKADPVENLLVDIELKVISPVVTYAEIGNPLRLEINAIPVDSLFVDSELKDESFPLMILLNGNPFNEEIIADPVDSEFVERLVTILFPAPKTPVAKDPDVKSPITTAFCIT